MSNDNHIIIGPVTTPAAPAGLAAGAGNGQVTLSWPAVNGAASYNIYRSTVSGAETLLAPGLVTTSYVDNSVVNGSTYYYVVAAVDPTGTSPMSNEVFATPQAAPAPNTQITVAEVQQVITMMVKVAGGIVAVINNPTISSIVTFCENIANQSWFAQLVTSLINSFVTTGKMPNQQEVLKHFGISH